MVFIVIFNIIIYVLLIVWTYKNMYLIEIKPKFICILLAIIVIYILTIILYNIGGNPIGKGLGEAGAIFNRTMTIIFTGINGLFTMPHIGLVFNKYKEQLIDNSGLKKRLIIIGVIFIGFLIFEFNYMKDMQVNMLGIINNKYNF